MEINTKSDVHSSCSKSKGLFIMFGILQTLTMGTLIFLLFNGLNTVNGSPVIGLDTQIVMSILPPVFIYIVEYMIYLKK